MLSTQEIVRLDRKHLWHPFTPSKLWLDSKFQPISIASGRGAWLTATNGRRYLDGNSSIWTNLHGHRHPAINRAITQQLGRIAHSSFLGLTHEAAARLARDCVAYANPHKKKKPILSRLFFSDDGSTAVEAGLKIILQFFAQSGQPQRNQFISPDGAYHGDTVGAMSLSQSEMFHRPFRPVLFRSQKVMAPSCYRCRFNRAKPQNADARSYRQCKFECASLAVQAIKKTGNRLAAWILEPRVQGAAGMVMHPEGYAACTSQAARDVGAKVVFDEVMTGFGRTGSSFAFHQEKIQPDVLALAKGFSGGYLPLAATLTTDSIFRSFSGNPSRTFFHGHSYTANPLGCAAAQANLQLLQSKEEELRRKTLIHNLRKLSARFWQHPNVGDVRQEGAILAVELVANRKTRARFPSQARRGARVCQAAQSFGLLTRPVGDVLVLMPPYCTTPMELAKMVDALFQGLAKEIPF